jgi:RHS repeat-associated protein
LYFLHDDQLGTPQLATDTTQAVAWVGNYQPFGGLNIATSQTGALTQDLRLPGQENDEETGMYHNGFRDYVPSFGRYAESDPIGLSGGLNTYRYAGANPVAFIDSEGLEERAPFPGLPPGTVVPILPPGTGGGEDVPISPTRPTDTPSSGGGGSSPCKSLSLLR